MSPVLDSYTSASFASHLPTVVSACASGSRRWSSWAVVTWRSRCCRLSWLRWLHPLSWLYLHSNNVVSINIFEWKQKKNIPMAQNTSFDVFWALLPSPSFASFTSHPPTVVSAYASGSCRWSSWAVVTRRSRCCRSSWPGWLHPLS